MAEKPHEAASLSHDEATGTFFWSLNEAESEFLFQDLFVKDTYFKHGISLQNGDTVIDVGANIGLFSLRCLSQWSDLRIVAVEPAPPCFEVLKANFALYPGNDQRVALQLAIGDTAQSQVKFTYYPNVPGESTCHGHERDSNVSVLVDAAEKAWLLDTSLGSSFLIKMQQHTSDKEEEVLFVEQVTLSSILDTQEVVKVDLLKIDCEGDELNVLFGVEDRHWQCIKQVVMEICDRNDRLQQCIMFLRSKGFSQIEVVQQDSSFIHGFYSFVPRELNLYMLYAKKLL